jgi:hypothetical protein
MSNAPHPVAANDDGPELLRLPDAETRDAPGDGADPRTERNIINITPDQIYPREPRPWPRLTLEGVVARHVGLSFVFIFVFLALLTLALAAREALSR